MLIKIRWFKQLGWFYLTISVLGTIITLAVLAFRAQAFLVVGRKSHSVSDPL
jgi:hypothetical protein